MQRDHMVPVKLILICPPCEHLHKHLLEGPERHILRKKLSKTFVLSSLAVSGTTEDFFCVQRILNDHKDITVSHKSSYFKIKN